MSQQTEQVRDSSGNRWIKCEICGLIDTDDKFVSYGGTAHINLGTCYNCSRKKWLTLIIEENYYGLIIY